MLRAIFDPFHLNVLPGFCAFFVLAERVTTSLMICSVSQQTGFLTKYGDTGIVGLRGNGLNTF